MFRAMLVGLFLAGSTSAFAQEWIEMTSSDSDVYSAKQGSFEVGKNKGGETIAVVIGSTYTKASRSYNYGKWYVTGKDCQAGMGTLVSLSTKGEFKFETEFVSGGNSVASGIADTICSLYSGHLRVREGKGL
ncbi:hypothetical protein [Hydrogenophaga borbori]|uniref:hypothetical protein n=1 Tax=Hydrogenophaga borbori TaxID=2294117 RepID=UPI00301C5210